MEKLDKVGKAVEGTPAAVGALADLDRAHRDLILVMRHDDANAVGALDQTLHPEGVRSVADQRVREGVFGLELGN
jgi:hypothetical protein